MTPDQYAQAVRDALADHPDREELLEDLDDHLAEIAADTDLPLEVRLGPPEIYAEELAAAYGERPRDRRKRRADPRAWVLGAHTRLMGQAPYRGVAGFLPELRPGWWVLRGYVLAMLALSVTGGGRLVPGDLAELAAVAVAIWASVWVGRWRGGRLLGLAVLAANVLAAVVLLGAMASATTESHEPAEVYMAQAQPVWVNNTSADGVYNIRPYAKDGTPLTDVYLYDQDGNPLTTSPQDFGFTVDRSCGEPVLNRYPLPLIDEREAMAAQDGTATSAPAPCSSPSPGPGKVPAPAGGESPAQADATPKPVPSPTR